MSTQKAYSVPSIDTESCVLNNIMRQQQEQQQDKSDSKARATARLAIVMICVKDIVFFI